jgi:hypothetical protein
VSQPAVGADSPRAAQPDPRSRSRPSAADGTDTSATDTSGTDTSGFDPARPERRRPLPSAALDLLGLARHGLAEAASSTHAVDRYAAAHLAALRTAAAVLAARAHPTGRVTRRHGPRSAWALLPGVAPELNEWAAFFAAGAGKRAAAEAGLVRAVTTREADDLLRAAETFLALVETTLGLAHQTTFPATTRAS